MPESLFRPGWLAALATAGLVAACGGDHDDTRYRAEVRRTSHGIAHIVADSEAGAAYGAGVAYAQDNLCLLADHVLTVNGERSRWFGPEAQGSAPTGMLPNRVLDVHYRRLNGEAAVHAAWARHSPDAQALLRAYAAGYNRVLRDLGAAGWPQACRNAGWVRPIDEHDLVRLERHYATVNGVTALMPLFAGAQPPGGAASLQGSPAAAGVRGLVQLMSHHKPTASNALALGADATDTGGGLLLGQPHFPWHGLERLFQLHLTVHGGMDVMGASLPGMPVVNIGFTQGYAWSHTTSSSAHFTLYRLTLDPRDPTRYLVDGESRPMKRDTVRIEVLGADGRVTPEDHTVYSTEFGWVLDDSQHFAWTAASAYALRDVNLDNARMLDQWLQMNRARDLPALKQAVLQVLGNPWSNTIAADAEGNTLFMAVTPVPRLGTQRVAACLPQEDAPYASRGLFVLDGSTQGCAWEDDPAAPQAGIFAAADLPVLERRDFVHNANNSAWLTNPAAPVHALSPVISRDDEAPLMRPRLGLVQVEQRLAGTDGQPGRRMSLQQLKDLALGNRVHLADLVLPDLLQACMQWAADPDPRVQEGCRALREWNGTANLAAGIGYGYFERIGLGLLKLEDAAPWRVAYDPQDPVHTPRGLAVDQPGVADALRAGLVDAVQAVQASGWTPGMHWGEVQGTTRGDRRIPLHGGLDDLGIYNVIDSEPDSRWREAAGGTSYLQAVGLGHDGPKAFALLAYSQSADPQSPWFADQTERFSARQWVELPFSEARPGREAGPRRPQRRDQCVDCEWAPPGVEMPHTALPAIVLLSFCDRSPTETMPTRRLSRLSTGRRRTWFLPMLTATSSSTSSSKQYRTSRDIASATRLSGPQWRATARTAMSRSVIMPTSRSPSPTGSAPTSCSAIRRAASQMLWSGLTIRTSRVIASRTFMASTSIQARSASGCSRCWGHGVKHLSKCSRMHSRSETPPAQPAPPPASTTAACTRELRFSLRRMCCTWILTVVSAMPRSRAIALLLAPCAMWCRISCSRGDRLASGSAGWGSARACRALTSLPVSSGLTTESPRAMRRMASASSSPSAVFNR